MRIENNELMTINGGAITSALITSVVRFITTVIDFGKMVGSSIRRGISRDFC